MKKVSLLFSAILLIFFLIACTESSSTSADQNEKEEPSSEEASSDKQKKEEASSEEKKKEETKPPQPYQPIEPAEDAKPLKESMTEEQLAKMPKVEAHGGERERMIPVGADPRQRSRRSNGWTVKGSSTGCLLWTSELDQYGYSRGDGTRRSYGKVKGTDSSLFEC